MSEFAKEWEETKQRGAEELERKRKAARLLTRMTNMRLDMSEETKKSFANIKEWTQNAQAFYML